MQDVPRSTDHAPSKTFYTFRANTASAFGVMQHDIVHALLNLRLRHKHERDKEEDVRFLSHFLLTELFSSQCQQP